jgi:hypothetical protein
VAQVIPGEVVPVDGFTEDDARFYGILLGDGHLTGAQRRQAQGRRLRLS